MYEILTKIKEVNQIYDDPDKLSVEKIKRIIYWGSMSKNTLCPHIQDFFEKEGLLIEDLGCGKSGKIKHLLLEQKALEQKGIEFYQTNRGGDITFHGPGQLVVYPILDLDNFFTDIHKYLRFLEEAVIGTLKEYGLKATRSPGETGVWLDVGTPFARKICAMGVRASRWVTMHGLALNLNTDLGYFDHIVPCGIIGKGVTSLAKELGKEIDVERVKEKFKIHFENLFKSRWIEG